MPFAFWLTNRLVNPGLRPLLRGPAGRLLGRSLAVLRYQGSRTGRPHELIAPYRRQGATAWVRVGFPERKVWWRNLRTPAPVDVWLAGEHHRATAVAIEGSRRPEEAAAGLAAFGRTGGRPADLGSVVLVRLDVGPE